MASLVSLIKKTFGGKPSVHRPEWAQGYEAYRGKRASKWVCMAPFKSMYFGHGGQVVTCCYNRNHPLGNYPQRSISEIWNGPEANELREHIKAYELDYGCHGCKAMMEAGNYEAVKAAQYDPPVENRNGYPSVMEFELSNECNLGCVMCVGEFSSYIRKHVEKLPPIPSAYGPEFIEQLEEFIPYLEETKFYGGEPFLIPIYQEIWDKIVELSPKTRVCVQTNATILSDRVKKTLEKGAFHINISIDSLQKERYENIRRNAVFEKVMENILYIREYTRRKDSFFGLSFCLMRSNWEEAADFIRFCNKYDGKAYFHTVSTPDSMSLMTWGIEPLTHILETFEGVIFEAETDMQRENVRHFEHWIRQIQQWKTDFEFRTAKINGARFMEALRQRMESRKDQTKHPELLDKLAWMQEIGFPDRQTDITMAQITNETWLDYVTQLVISKSKEELLEMMVQNG